MGHRKYSAPRRGSVAFRPRARARSLEAKVRTWPQVAGEKSSLVGFAGFKVGGIHILTIDDREKTPNFGKQLLNVCTVIATPPLKVIGVRGYKTDLYGQHAIFDAYAKDLPKELSRRVEVKQTEDAVAKAEAKVGQASSVVAIVSVTPSSIGISQKKPFVFELAVSGKDAKAQFEYVKGVLGKEIKASDIFQLGQNVDVFGITRGKGIEGPVTRFGIKRKQHKSRKSVRAVGTLGPISPAVVMYTVARQGQHGFHQRTEYNKRILVMSNTEKDGQTSINPTGGFKHYGLVKGDYIVVRGSIPGVPKRLVKMRHPIRSIPKKVQEPKVLEVVVQ
ncbi:50S ribosomal protein L3 [Candidatus Nitrososphaera sp. FF02]|uniref:50S ribosomal protein L3 n=1 Tax=Candidatus Nitrososphaera sp. FF02 TaxID=3398226 RepID=UPI0039E865EB